MKIIPIVSITILNFVSFLLPTIAEPILTIEEKDIFTNKAQIELVAVLNRKDFKRADDILKSLPIDERGINGGTILWWEAGVGDFEAFEYLLKKGAKLGQGSPKNTYNTVELSVKQEDLRFLKSVIEYHGNINMIGYFTRQTPIYAAILSRQNNNVKMLIKNGAYLNIVDPSGFTPLLWAANASAFDLVPMLLSHGADPSVRDLAGFSALDILHAAQVRIKTDHPLYNSYIEAVKVLEKVNK
jgi:ankyrin repeat protein